MEDLSTYWPWLFLLLPVVYLLGWLKGRKHASAAPVEQRGSLRSDYFKGLNYLLSDQQEKALPVFLRLTQDNSDTVEINLALASIYRKSGNIDQAIELHQNLIARPSISSEFRSKALLELGRDYLAAGLFDRAEGLFNDVIKSGFYSAPAKQYMLTIYQQEKEWEEAINVAASLIQDGDNSLRPVIAQFYCELSDKLISQGNVKQAEKMANKALSYHEGSIRAYIILAKLARNAGKLKNAIKYLQLIEKYDPEFFPAVLVDCVDCYRDAGRLPELVEYLKKIEREHPELNFMEITVKLISEQQGDTAALNYLVQQLQKKPDISSLTSYLKLNQRLSSDQQKLLSDTGYFLDKMQLNEPQYQCRKCGYVSGTMYWQCPGCHSWGHIKPVAGTGVKVR